MGSRTARRRTADRCTSPQQRLFLYNGLSNARISTRWLPDFHPLATGFLGGTAAAWMYVLCAVKWCGSRKKYLAHDTFTAPSQDVYRGTNPGTAGAQGGVWCPGWCGAQGVVGLLCMWKISQSIAPHAIFREHPLFSVACLAEHQPSTEAILRASYQAVTGCRSVFELKFATNRSSAAVRPAAHPKSYLIR